VNLIGGLHSGSNQVRVVNYVPILTSGLLTERHHARQHHDQEPARAGSRTIATLPPSTIAAGATSSATFISYASAVTQAETLYFNTSFTADISNRGGRGLRDGAGHAGREAQQLHQLPGHAGAERRELVLRLLRHRRRLPARARRPARCSCRRPTSPPFSRIGRRSCTARPAAAWPRPACPRSTLRRDSGAAPR